MHGVFIPSLAGIQLLFKAILPERIGVNTLFYLPFSVSATGFCGRLPVVSLPRNAVFGSPLKSWDDRVVGIEEAKGRLWNRKW